MSVGVYGGNVMWKGVESSAESSGRVYGSLVCKAETRTEYSTPWLDTSVWSSQAEVRGWTGVISSVLGGPSYEGDLSFLEDELFFGWEATLPLFCGVPVMKTRSRSYPSHCLPLDIHFWQ
jgi:hypothetical protein